MNGGLTMRSSRLRTVLYGIVLLGMVFVVYLLSSTHSQLKEIEGSNEKCQQQKDSLSAQLQVAYEYKNRLERSLQKEKGDHKHQQEEMLKQNNELKAQLEKEKQEASRKYNKLLKDHQSLQNRQQQLEVEIVQLQNSQKNLEEEKKQASLELTQQIHTLQQQKDDEVTKLQVLLNNLMQEKDALQQSNMKEAWEKKRNADALQLCQIAHEKLKEKCEATELSGKLSKPKRIRQYEKPVQPPYPSKVFKPPGGGEHKPQIPGPSLKKEEMSVDRVIRNSSSPSLIGPKPSSSTSPQNNNYPPTGEHRQEENFRAQVLPPNNYNANSNGQKPEHNEEVPNRPLVNPIRYPNYEDNHIAAPHVLPRPGPGPDDMRGMFPNGMGPPSFDHRANKVVERSVHDEEPPRQVGILDQLKPKLVQFPMEQNHKVGHIKRGPHGHNNAFAGPRMRDENEENEAGDDGGDDDNDDPDPDNALDDHAAGAGHRGKEKVFQDADFDDQENEGENPNQPNQEGEEGVAVVPK